MIKCGLISQKGAHSDMTTIILNDQWNLFISEYELVNVEINKSKVGESVGNKFFFSRDASFIQIGNKYYPSYLKATKQYSISHLLPVINTCHISRIFFHSITIDILDYIRWNECINNNSLKSSEV